MGNLPVKRTLSIRLSAWWRKRSADDSRAVALFLRVLGALVVVAIIAAVSFALGRRSEQTQPLPDVPDEVQSGVVDRSSGSAGDSFGNANDDTRAIETPGASFSDTADVPQQTVPPEPTDAPVATAVPTATPVPNVVSGFDLPPSNHSMTEEQISKADPIDLGGIDFDRSVSLGINPCDDCLSFGKSDWMLIEFPAKRRFECFSAAIGLTNSTDPERTAVFEVIVDGDLYESREIDKFDLWRLELRDLLDTGFVEIRWQFPDEHLQAYGVVADPLFYRVCP